MLRLLRALRLFCVYADARWPARVWQRVFWWTWKMTERVR